VKGHGFSRAERTTMEQGLQPRLPRLPSLLERSVRPAVRVEPAFHTNSTPSLATTGQCGVLRVMGRTTGDGAYYGRWGALRVMGRTTGDGAYYG